MCSQLIIMNEFRIKMIMLEPEQHVIFNTFIKSLLKNCEIKLVISLP